VILSPGLPRQKQLSARRRLFSPAKWLNFKEETSEMLHLKYSFVQYLNRDTS
jgi:hypothetical protein